MPKLKSFIQKICREIFTIPFKISKKMYRNFAILCVSGVVVSAISFASTSFAASGKNNVFAYTYSSKDEEQNLAKEDLNEEEGEELLVDSFISLENNLDEDYSLEAIISNSQNEGQLLVASHLLSDIELAQESAKNEQEKIEQIRGEIQEYKERKAEEERKAMQMEERRQQFDMSSFTDEDYTNLLRIVEAEAGVNDVRGKMLVANVILNRVKSLEFPNNITEVIMSKGQFSPVSNGRFYRVSISDGSKEAVERALSGEDNSQGALFFMNRGASNKGAVTWFDKSLEYLFSYGGHEYFK